MSRYTWFAVCALALFSMVSGESRAARKRCVFSRVSVAAERRHQNIKEDVRAGRDPRFVSVVVPMYREMENGNLFRLLEDFTAQGASPRQFELVLIVNNTAEVATAKDAVFRENQRTLEVLRWVAGQSARAPDFLGDLPRWQQDAVAAAKKRGLRIVIQDLSTKGFERNMGKIRDHGVQDALKRHERLDSDHLLGMLDSDTRVNPAYIEGAIGHFANPEVNAIFLDRNWVVEAGAEPRIYQDTYAHRRTYADGGLIAAFVDLASGGGGPQTLGRANSFRKVGGIMHMPIGEDGMLAMSLAELGGVHTPPDVQIRIGDRQRPDGYDAINRMQAARAPERYTSVPEKLLVQALAQYHKKKGAISPGEAKRFFDYFAIPFPAEAWEGALGTRGDPPKEGLLRNAGFSYRVDQMLAGLPKNAKAKVTPDDLMGFLKGKLAKGELEILQARVAATAAAHDAGVRELKRQVEAMYERSAENDPRHRRFSDPMVDEFLSGNDWIAKRISDARTAGQSAKTIIQNLEKDFPDWFLPFARTPLKREVETMTVLRDFAREGARFPGLFPSLDKIRKVATTGEIVDPEPSSVK